MTRVTITAHFTEPNEYLAELERDQRQVERGIVRVTKIAMPDSTGAITHVTVEATAIIEHRLCRLSTYCGALWGIDHPDEEVQTRASTLVRELEEKLLDLGLEVRAGRWHDT
jgi:hypothetical protein